MHVIVARATQPAHIERPRVVVVVSMNAARFATFGARPASQRPRRDGVGDRDVRSRPVWMQLTISGGVLRRLARVVCIPLGSARVCLLWILRPVAPTFLSVCRGGGVTSHTSLFLEWVVSPCQASRACRRGPSPSPTQADSPSRDRCGPRRTPWCRCGVWRRRACRPSCRPP